MTRLLLVEDNDLIRDMLARRLATRGYEVLLAADGSEALAQALADAPDLILLDLTLPVIDGWEAARRLKAEATTRGIPIVALSAHAMAADRERALAAGCDAYETKPINFPRLLGLMERLLNRAPEPG